MNVEFITESDRWNQELHIYGGTNVYIAPEYVSATAPEQAIPLLIKAWDERGELFIPTIKRPLPECCSMPGMYDAESPYGFPGVVFEGYVQKLWEDVAKALVQEKIINLFIRSNPFAENPFSADWIVDGPHPIACIPLKKGINEAFASPGCRGHRRKVRKALKLGMFGTIIQAAGEQEIERFYRIYTSSMERKQARREYFFSLDYFKQLCSGLRSNVLFAEVYDCKSNLQAAGCFLCSGDIVHYHLGARAENAHYSAFNLLFSKTAEWCETKGFSLVNLGGGMSSSENDPLWMFKRRVGSERNDFRVAGLVADIDVHNELRKRYEAKTGIPPVRFQCYR